MSDNNPFVLIKFSHNGNVYPYIGLRYEANSKLINNDIGDYNINDDIITINRPPPTNDDETFVVVYNNPPPTPPPGDNKIRIIPLSRGQNNDTPEGRPDAAAAEATAVESMKALALQSPGVVTVVELSLNEYDKLYKNFKAKAENFKANAAHVVNYGGRRRLSAKKHASRRKPRSAKKRATRRYRHRRRV